MTRAAALAVLVLAAASAPASADPNAAAQASTLASAGAKLYSANDYLGAGQHFDEAYAIDPLPSYLFNAAQAYRLGNACDKSAARYQRFLDVAANAQNVEKVRKYLEDERACSKDHAPAVAPPPVTPPPVTPPPVTPVVAPAQPLPVAPPRAAPADRHTLRLAGITVGIAGVVVFGVGAYEGIELVQAKSDLSACNAHPGTCTTGHAKDIDSTGKTANIVAPLGLAVGGAAIAGGVVLYLLGRDPETASIAPTAGGAVLSTRFRF